jgi:hypothetical protein
VASYRDGIYSEIRYEEVVNEIDSFIMFSIFKDAFCGVK